jgi:hypothetical protein
MTTRNIATGTHTGKPREAVRAETGCVWVSCAATAAGLGATVDVGTVIDGRGDLDLAGVFFAVAKSTGELDADGVREGAVTDALC